MTGLFLFIFLLMIINLVAIVFLIFWSLFQAKKNHELVSKEVQASVKATLKNMLGSVNISTETTEKLIRQELKSLLSENVKQITDLARKSEERLFNQAQTSIQRSTAQFTSNVQQVQKDLTEDIESQQNVIAREIEAYKTAQLEKVDERIGELVQQVATSVLSESIDTNKHAKLIMQSLEQAKKDNVI